MKIALSSDWHHDAYTDGVARADDIEEAVNEVVDAAIEAAVDAFFCLGDITDPNHSRSHYAVNYAARVSRKLDDHEIPSVWLTGNHDVIEDGNGGHTMMVLDHGLSVVWDRPGLKEIGGMPVLALPFTPASHTYDPDALVRSVYAAHGEMHQLLVVGHLSMDGMHPGSETLEMPRGRDIMWPLEALNELYPDAILVGGHYHRAQTFKGVNIVGSPVRFRHDEETNTPQYMLMELT